MKYLLLLIFCLGACNSSVLQENQNSEQINQNKNGSTQTNEAKTTLEEKKELAEITSDIPKDSWEQIFFESINERTDEAGLQSLRKTSLGKEDLEVRVWIGFGLTKLEGFILKRLKSNWSAIYVDSDYISKKFVSRNIKLDEPSDGWRNTWQKLLNENILSLPDAESINCNAGSIDGFSYVFEIKKGNNYRTYMYENPENLKAENCKEVENVLTILKIISKEYRINERKNSEK